jgi:Fis family transcriptional regulator
MGASAAQRGQQQRAMPTAAGAERGERAERIRAGDGVAAGSNGATHPSAGVPPRKGETIGECIVRTLDQYFRDLDGAKPHQLHEMVMQAVERPLLKFALDRCEGNQSHAAELLGINRNTLRKKLIDHGFAEGPAPKPAARKSARGTSSRSARRKR